MTALTSPVDIMPSRAPTGIYRKALRRFFKHRLAVIGLVFLVLVILAALCAPLIAPHDPDEVFWDAIHSPPSAEFWLGTDEIGRDILSRLIYGARVSLEIVFGSIALALLVGAAIGLLSGYAGSWLDDILMRITDGLLAFPSLILALGIIAVLGPNTTNAMLALAITNIPNFARLVRGQTLLVREQEFVQAARALGASHLRIMANHIWPSVVGNVIVYASLRLLGALLDRIVAGLSRFGRGAADAKLGADVGHLPLLHDFLVDGGLSWTRHFSCSPGF